MAEWLRRLTRNQMGSSRVGSNPTRSGTFVFYCNKKQWKCTLLNIPNVAAAMAEWLRRLTRNQMGSSRVGSNPTRSDPFIRVSKCTPLCDHSNKNAKTSCI